MPVRAKKKTVTALTPQALQKLINKEYGAGTMKFASDPSLQITRIPTGILSIDDALGGGFARGRHTEIYGTFSVGKSYIAERLIAKAQELGYHCGYVDAEGTFDPAFAEYIGIDNDELAYHRQQNGPRCVDFMETLLRSELYDVLILDSIAALLPQSEAEQPTERATMGTAQAKLMSAALRKLTTANKKTVLIYINQTREAVGVMFGNKTITSGGKAMGFYASTRLEIVRTESIKRKARVVNASSGVAAAKDVVKGHRALVRVIKDKTGGAMSQRQTTFVFDYDLKGIDHIEDLMYLGRHYGMVKKSGSSWWLEGYEDEAQGSRAKFKAWLRRSIAVQEELEDLIKEAGSEQAEADEEVEDEDDEG